MSRTRQAAADPAERGERPSALILVRCWLEPSHGDEPVVRGYIRDLRSGEETPIGDVKAVEEHVRRQLRLPASAIAGRRQARIA